MILKGSGMMLNVLPQKMPSDLDDQAHKHNQEFKSQSICVIKKLKGANNIPESFTTESENICNT